MAEASITASPPRRKSQEVSVPAFNKEVGGACAPPGLTLLAVFIYLPAIASRICLAASLKALSGASDCWEINCCAFPQDVHTADISGIAGIGRPSSPASAKAAISVSVMAERTLRKAEGRGSASK